MPTVSEMQNGDPYEVDRSDDSQPGDDKSDKNKHGEGTGKKSRREVEPPIKRKPNQPAKPE